MPLRRLTVGPTWQVGQAGLREKTHFLNNSTFCLKNIANQDLKNLIFKPILGKKSQNSTTLFHPLTLVPQTTQKQRPYSLIPVQGDNTAIYPMQGNIPKPNTFFFNKADHKHRYRCWTLSGFSLLLISYPTGCACGYFWATPFGVNISKIWILPEKKVNLQGQHKWGYHDTVLIRWMRISGVILKSRQ